MAGRQGILWCQVLMPILLLCQACTPANTVLSVYVQITLILSSDSQACVIPECCTGYAVVIIYDLFSETKDSSIV